MSVERPTAIVVTTFEGDPTVEERAAAAARGERPRKDFVELAARLPGAVVIDVHHMRERALPLARAVAKLAGLPAGQVVEVFLRRRRYSHVLAWADRLGLPLALLAKATRSRIDIVLVSVLLTRGAKAFLIGRLRLHTHLRAIVVRSLQKQLLVERFGVPAEKLILERFGVDEQFFHPVARPRAERLICAVGWEERDYETLLRAVEKLDAEVELALGSIAMAEESSELDSRMQELVDAGATGNVRITNRTPRELRELYSAATCVVVPVKEAGFDAGVTATVEAMACARAVVVSRTEGLSGLFTHGQEGLFVEPGDAGALRVALERLLDDPEEADRMGRAGRSLVERRHRLDDRIDALAAAVLSTPSR